MRKNGSEEKEKEKEKEMKMKMSEEYNDFLHILDSHRLSHRVSSDSSSSYDRGVSGRDVFLEWEDDVSYRTPVLVE